MKPLRAFFFSFGAGLIALFTSHAALSTMLAPQPDVQIGPSTSPPLDSPLRAGAPSSPSRRGCNARAADRHRSCWPRAAPAITRATARPASLMPAPTAGRRGSSTKAAAGFRARRARLLFDGRAIELAATPPTYGLRYVSAEERRDGPILVWSARGEEAWLAELADDDSTGARDRPLHPAEERRRGAHAEAGASLRPLDCGAFAAPQRPFSDRTLTRRWTFRRLGAYLGARTGARSGSGDVHDESGKGPAGRRHRRGAAVRGGARACAGQC